jgi:hypothetical protein
LTESHSSRRLLQFGYSQKKPQAWLQFMNHERIGIKVVATEFAANGFRCSDAPPKPQSEYRALKESYMDFPDPHLNPPALKFSARVVQNKLVASIEIARWRILAPVTELIQRRWLTQ